MNFNLIIYYCIFFFFNVIFFSLISIYIYKLLCIDINLLFFLKFKDYSLYNNFEFFYIPFSDIIYLEYFYLYKINNIFFFFQYQLFIQVVFFLDNYFFVLKKDNYIQLFFFTKVNLNIIEIHFWCLQNYIILFYSETCLVFFRLNNLTLNNYYAISIYIVFPLYYSIFINKIQCFCFSKIYIIKNESIDLPVVFFVDSFFISFTKIYLFYLLILF